MILLKTMMVQLRDILSQSINRGLSKSICLQAMRYTSQQSSKGHTMVPRNCKSTDPPVKPCSKEDCVSSGSCAIGPQQTKNVCKPGPWKKPKFQSMWKPTDGVKNDALHPSQWNYPPECCPQCDNDRFDLLYYRPSNKCQMNYQRTWWECVPRMVPKKVCCHCDALPPEYEKRELPLCPRENCCKLNFPSCSYKKDTKCPRLIMPCCRTGRVPPFCHAVRKKTDCEKPKCPLPSYSECDREDPAVLPLRPAECCCYRGQNLCLALKYKARRTKVAAPFCSCPICPFIKD